MNRCLITALAMMPLLASCMAPCQRLCDDMADYAAECGRTVTDAELQACYDAQDKELTSEAAQEVCADQGDALQEEWTCEDLTLYMGEG